MIKVYCAGGLDDASLIRILLEGNGIQVVIEGALLEGTEAHLTRLQGISVLVNEEDHDEACRIIAEHQPQPSECPNCGYDLTGLPEARCPECGEAFYRREKKPPWTCVCGEEVEGQFTACWKCGYENFGEEAEPKQ